MLSLHNKSSFIILTNDNESAEKSTTFIFLSSHSFLFLKQRVVYMFEILYWGSESGNFGWYSNLRLPFKKKTLWGKPFMLLPKTININFIVELLKNFCSKKSKFSNQDKSPEWEEKETLRSLECLCGISFRAIYSENLPFIVASVGGR